MIIFFFGGGGDGEKKVLVCDNILGWVSLKKSKSPKQKKKRVNMVSKKGP